MSYSRLELANAHLEAGDLDDALAALDAELTENPDNDDALRLRAGILIRAATDDGYRRALEDLNHLREPTVEDIVQKAYSLNELYEIDAALEQIETAVRLGGQRYVGDQISILMSAFRFAEARALVDTMPRTWRWLEFSGDLAVRHEGPARAIQDYTLALEAIDALPADPLTAPILASSRARLLCGRARMFCQQEDWSRAHDE
jgi:hypothetical protein